MTDSEFAAKRTAASFNREFWTVVIFDNFASASVWQLKIARKLVNSPGFRNEPRITLDADNLGCIDAGFECKLLNRKPTITTEHLYQRAKHMKAKNFILGRLCKLFGTPFCATAFLKRNSRSDFEIALLGDSSFVPTFVKFKFHLYLPPVLQERPRLAFRHPKYLSENCG